MVADNQRILETSHSACRRHRADRMLANLQPHLARLERIEAAAAPAPTPTGEATRPRRDYAGYEVVWDGSVR